MPPRSRPGLRPDTRWHWKNAPCGARTFPGFPWNNLAKQSRKLRMTEQKMSVPGRGHELTFSPRSNLALLPRGERGGQAALRELTARGLQAELPQSLAWGYLFSEELQAGPCTAAQLPLPAAGVLQLPVLGEFCPRHLCSRSTAEPSQARLTLGASFHLPNLCCRKVKGRCWVWRRLSGSSCSRALLGSHKPRCPTRIMARRSGALKQAQSPKLLLARPCPADP